MVLLIALVLLALAPQAAFATFPGRNGDLMVVENSQSHPISDVVLWRFNSRTGRLLRDLICNQVDGAPTPCYRGGPPAVSPDGRSVAVVTRDVVPPRPPPDDSGIPLPREWSIRVFSLDTGTWTQIRLPEKDPVPYLQPIVRWAPGPNFLVVVAVAPISDDQLFEPAPAKAVLVGPDASDRGQVIADLSSPDVASDGRLAFVRDGDVHLLEPGGAVRRLTFKGGDQPSWSPHGRFVAFSRKGYVYVVPAKGGRARRLTRGVEPTWSPDGKRIAFFRTTREPNFLGDDTTYIYVLNRRSGRVRRLSNEYVALEGAYADATSGLDWQVAR